MKHFCGNLKCACALLLVMLLPMYLQADPIQGSPRVIDSLIIELGKTKIPNNKLIFLDRISIGLSRSNPDLGLKYAFEELALARREKMKDHEAESYYNIGSNYFSKGNSAEALKAFFKAMSIFESMGNRKEYGLAAGNVGGVYWQLKNYDKAIKYHTESLNIARDFKDDERVNGCLNNLGLVYMDMGKPYKALPFFKQALQIAQKSLNNHAQIASIGNIAGTYYAQKAWDSALIMGLEALQLAREAEDKQQIAIFLGNVGEIYHVAANDTGFGNTGKLIPASNKEKLAIAANYLKQSIQLSREIHFTDGLYPFMQALSDLYMEQGDYEKALATYKQVVAGKDSLFNITNSEKIAKLETERALQLKQKDIEIAKLAVAKKRSERIYYISGIVVLLIAIGLIIRQRRLNEKKMKDQFTRRLGDLEMTALRSQMNPHFIFNCLNSINRYIVKSDQQNASRYLTRFSKLIRLILENSAEEMTTLNKEIELLKLYMEMESLRFSDRFTYTIQVDDALHGEERIPAMVIQPYIENAIWHGLMHRDTAGGGLQVSIEKISSQSLRVVVEDNGIGRERAAELKSKESSLSHKSYGMKVTGDRLRILGEMNEVQTSAVIEDLKDSENNPMGTRVVLQLPFYIMEEVLAVLN